MRASQSEAQAYEYISSLVYDRCRVRLQAGKQHLIRSRLGQRLRAHGLASMTDYCDFLRRQPDETEITQVVDALTTNFTKFMRDRDHFEFMVAKALPAVLGPLERAFNVWSAASATGEEAYSIAFYLADHYPTAAGWDWQILGTDISTRALATARAGVYPMERAHAVPKEWLRRYCQRGTGEYEGQFRIKPMISERVDFQPLNLLGAFSFPRPFSLIFCRNVMIYFDRPTRQQLITELSRHLVPGGYLLVGHSETLLGLDLPFQCERPSIYRKL